MVACYLVGVVGYSSIMIGIRHELRVSDESREPAKHIAAQENIDTNDRDQDPGLCSPLVAGSSPRHTSEGRSSGILVSISVLGRCVCGFRHAVRLTVP